MSEEQGSRRRKSRRAKLDELRTDLESVDPAVRAGAIGRATEHLRDEPWLLGTVRRLFREDPDDAVRMSAIDPLRLAGAYSDVLDDFMGALRDPSARVRRLAALTIGGLPYLASRRCDALVAAAALPDAPMADLGCALEDPTFDRRLRERLLECDEPALETLAALLTHMPERLRAIQSSPGRLSSRPDVMARLDEIIPVD